jgi:hypothetical protein
MILNSSFLGGFGFWLRIEMSASERNLRDEYFVNHMHSNTKDEMNPKYIA